MSRLLSWPGCVWVSAQSSSSEPHRTGADVAPPEISVTKSRTDWATSLTK